MTRVYDYDVEDGAVNVDVLDAQAYEQTWADMVRLQRDGVYPAAFAAIDVPVLMLHGDVDPHPGLLIAEDLREYILSPGIRRICGMWTFALAGAQSQNRVLLIP